MKILRNVRRLLSLIGFLSNERLFACKYGHLIGTAVIFTLLMMAKLTSISYMVTHWRMGDYENSVYAGLQVAAVMPNIVSIITMMYHKENVRQVISYFQRISDDCKSTELKAHWIGSIRFQSMYI